MTRLPLGLAFCLALLVVSAIPAWADRDVRVPKVEGLALGEALRVVEEAHLHPEVQWTLEGRRGFVHAQDPVAGARVPKASHVVLQVRRRLEIRTITPKVVGMDEAEAIAALEDVYVLVLEERRTRGGRDGRILEQDPSAGTQLLMGDVLRLVVGRRSQAGPIGIPLPDVTRMRHEEAETLLLDLGLVPVVSFFEVRRGRFGYVHTQHPVPDTLVAHGARVLLDVGVHVRPPKGQLRVPSLYGLDPEEAGKALQALQLRARFQRLPSRFSQDTVIRQQPATGATVLAGSGVTVVVAVPSRAAHVPVQVGVPDLVGVELAEAFARARRAGVQLVVRHRALRGRANALTVQAQRPPPHVAVPLGTQVRIDVPLGVAVPDFVGLSPDAAAESAWEAGLRLELTGDRRVRFGAVVVAQSPDAGVLLARGAIVRAEVKGAAYQGRVLVPEVRGRSVLDARRRLREAGLEARFTGPGPIPGAQVVVVEQRPAPGTRVLRATIVELTYGAQGAPALVFVVVPDLAGLSLAQARTRLLELGLAPVASTVRGPGRKGVTGQAPVPGTRVRKGSQVAFTVRQ